jgi:hypothetical protein
LSLKVGFYTVSIYIFALPMNKFLHISTAIYLILIILVKMMAMPISLMEYSFNKNYIAENLCENKAKSEMHCAGKCYLSKKLAKSNESPDSQNQKGVAKVITVDYCESLYHTSFQLIQENLLHSRFLHTDDISVRNSSPVFRPPIV